MIYTIYHKAFENKIRAYQVSDDTGNVGTVALGIVCLHVRHQQLKGS